MRTTSRLHWFGFPMSLFLAFAGGCDVHQPTSNLDSSRGVSDAPAVAETPATEDDMHKLVTTEATLHVLKNVDRPFDAKLEPGCIWIDPEDPILAHFVMYCTHAIDGVPTRSLFFTTFHNDVYPSFASNASDIRCVVVNRDGTVVFRDDEYYSGDTEEELKQAGAADTDGPPEVAVGLLRMAELRAKYMGQ